MSENTQQILTEPENKLPEFTFDQLPPVMHASIEKLGWRTPMPVQAKAVPYLLDKRDMIVQSRTGSGKTGAFLIPLLMRIDPGRRHPQALVLVPTRELAGQVYKEFQTLGQGLDVEGALLYGGVGYNSQLQSLRSGAQVIIGTPGRVLDHIGRRSLNLDRLNIIVFDEADEMLSMGFYPDMRELRRYLPRERSSWMFSATMPYKVQLLAREFLREPEFLSLSSGDVTVSTMEHRFYDVPPLEKDIMLMRLIELENPDSVIIFCNTKVEVEYVATVLRNYGYNADQLSGDLDQKSREKAMGRIRNGETRFLVATDVAARGIDISDLSHVIQYDVPKDPDSYVHRAGRTARAGNTGVVITFIANMSEKSDLKKIARRYNVEFVEMPAPTAEEVGQRMGERLTVVLEDRFRTGITRLERERMKRFLALTKSLGESEDESMLLAMLLDSLYHDTFHHAPVPAPEAHPEPPQRQQESRQQEPRQQESRQQEPRSKDRPQERSGDRPQERAGDRPQERAEERPQDEQELESPAEGDKKRKKRKRKRKRNRGGEGQQMPGESQMEQSGTPADIGGDRPAEGREPQPQREEQRKDDRQRDDRRKDERQKEDRPREDRPREDRPREDRRKDDRQSDQRSKEDRPKDQRPKERSAPPREEKKERPGSAQITSDSPWVESIQVIEPESWVEPEKSVKPQESRREERSKEEEKRPARQERREERSERREEPTASKQPSQGASAQEHPAQEQSAPESSAQGAATGKAGKSGSKKETAEAESQAPAAKGRKSSTKQSADTSAGEPAEASPSESASKSSRKGTVKGTTENASDAAEAPAAPSRAKKSAGSSKKEAAPESAPAKAGKGTKGTKAADEGEPAASTKKATKGEPKGGTAATKKGSASRKSSGDDDEPKATKRGKSK